MSDAAELARTCSRIDFKVGPIWTEVKSQDWTSVEAAFTAMVEDLRRGVPSVVCMHFGPTPDTSEHFRLVPGFDTAKDEVIFHDPAVSSGALRRKRPRRKLDDKQDTHLTYIRLYLLLILGNATDGLSNLTLIAPFPFLSFSVLSLNPHLSGDPPIGTLLPRQSHDLRPNAFHSYSGSVPGRMLACGGHATPCGSSIADSESGGLSISPCHLRG